MLPTNPAQSQTSNTTDAPEFDGTLTPPSSPFTDPLAAELRLASAKAKLFGQPVAAAKVGRFSILRELGRGGMGIVFAAYDEELDRRVAIKLLRQVDAQATDRFRREAQAMAKLSHPNVAQIYEVGVWDGRVYLALEYIEGHTLGAWLAHARPSSADIVAVLLQAGAGLCAAHQAGLVHRDFKPENVMVGNDGRVRVLDFGLAGVDRELEVEASADPRPALAQPTALELSLTRTGALLGTPAYMSPEQLRGERSSVASDCFGFCVVAHEALYGQRPFAGDTLVQLRDAIMDQQLCPIPRDRHVPAPLRTAILAGLASAPGERPSMQTLLDVLGRYATRTDSAQAPDPRTIESRVTLLAIATWVAILGATLKWAPARSDVPGDELVPRWLVPGNETAIELFVVDTMLIGALGIVSTACIGWLSRRRLREAAVPPAWSRLVGRAWPWVGLAAALTVWALLRAQMFDYDPRPMLQNLALAVWVVGLTLALPLMVAALEHLGHRRGRLLHPALVLAATVVMSLAGGACMLSLTWWAPLTLEPGSFIVLVAIPGIVAAGVGSSLAHC